MLRTACLRAVAAAGAFAAAPALAEEPKRGFSLGVDYTGDTFANLQGGKRPGVRAFGLAEITAEYESAGATAFANVQYVHGKSLSDHLVGDAQVNSNIDAPDGLRLFEAWVSIPFSDEGYVKAGLIDLNSEFDVQDVGALFVNSSHGIGPDFSQSGRNGPSIFPTTSTAVMVSFKRGNWSVRAGAFDAVSGNPDHPARTVVRIPGETGFLLVGEAEFRISEIAELQVGAWTYTREFERVDGSDRTAEGRGAYAMVEAQVSRISGQPLHAWVRVGTASAAANPIGVYAGGGLVFGPEARRAGLALSHARLGSTARTPGTEGAETIIEATYAHAINDRLIVQPDVQYVINPGFDRQLRNALVAGVRLQLRLF